MGNALARLLRKPTTLRTVDDYEQVYDDYVAFAGGMRLTSRFPVPIGCKNADYYFEFENCELILELKQIQSYKASRTVEEYFRELHERGRLRCFEVVGANRIRITPESLSAEDWHWFYKTFCPTVSNDLRDAARQIRGTNDLLPATGKRRIGGVVIVNSGNFNLSTDLLFRLVEWRMKREWRSRCLTSVDFVRCHTIDMVHDQQHLLHGRQIARSTNDALVVEVVRYLFDRWVHYGASAIGAQVQTAEQTLEPEVSGELNHPFSGKLVYCTHVDA